MNKNQDYVCYCVWAKTKNNRILTYVGITNNFARRLRQHNQKIKGGARYTKRAKNWKPLFHVRGFKCKTHALQFEWAMKHRKKGGGGLNGRFKTLCFLFTLERWTTRAPKKNTLNLKLWFSCKRRLFCKYSRSLPDVKKISFNVPIKDF